MTRPVRSVLTTLALPVLVGGGLLMGAAAPALAQTDSDAAIRASPMGTWSRPLRYIC